MEKRTFLNTHHDLGRHIDLRLNYALGWYPNPETIGSGLNGINTTANRTLSASSD